MRMMSKILALAAVLMLVGAACGDSGTDTTAGTTPPGTVAPTTAAPPTGGDGPGAGVTVTMARADWSTGYFQAAVYRQLLQELGYEVSDPAALELGPSLAYLSMAQGDFDFWVNSWYPGHLSWWDPELPDGSKVGDHLEVVGEELIAGGLQGYLMTKAFADKHGITTMDEFNANADAIAEYDAQDPVPGNGFADIYGCQESWTCDNIILNQIAFSGWDNIQETIAGYDAMMAEAVAKADNGEPMVIYTWTPSAYITQLIPGSNVIWLGVDETLDDSNPAGQDGGEAHDQRPGTANIGPEQCPSAAEKGTCQLGWIAADIQVTANKDFLDANPAARKLLELVKLPILDVSLANVEQANGRDTNEDIAELASEWIADNRALVDGWLNEARAAA